MEEVPVDDTTPMFPQFRVMPMGWTHALAFCQTIISWPPVGAPLSPALEDICPAPRLDPPVRRQFCYDWHQRHRRQGSWERCVERGPRVWAEDTRAVPLTLGTSSCQGLSFSDTGLLGQGATPVEALAGAPRTAQDHFASLAMVTREFLSVCRAVHVFAGRSPKARVDAAVPAPHLVGHLCIVGSRVVRSGRL